MRLTQLTKRPHSLLTCPDPLLGQVLLLPNFVACVMHEVRSVDGFDTIELVEQVTREMNRWTGK